MKKAIKAGLIVAGLGVVFGAGSMFGKDTGATGDWVTNAENNAYSELVTQANNTTDGLIANVDEDANAKVNEAIALTVDQKQAELDRLLKEYYQLRLEGLTESEQFKALEERIAFIQQDLLNTFKQRIDAEFNRVSGEQTTP